MYEKATLADPFVPSRIEREIKQELSSQRLRAAQSDPVIIVGGVLALIFCVFAAVAIGLGVVLFGPQSNSPQSNPVRLINAPGITTYSSAPQNRLAEATPNYNAPSNQPLTLGVGKDIPTPSSWGKDTVTPQPQTTWWSKLREYLPEVRFETSPQPQPKTQAAVTPQPQTTWWSKLREYLPEVRFETSPQPQPKTQAAVTPQPQSQWRSRLNEAWRWIQARLEEEWDKKPQRSYVPPQRSYVTPQQNYVQPPQNPYQRIQMRDAQLAQQRLQQQLQFERSQGYDRYAPPPHNGWYPVNPRQNYYRQY